MDPSPFSPESALSVTRITDIINGKLTQGPELQNIMVKGELLEFKVHPSSGHAYFTLTDKETPPGGKKATLRCNFFGYSRRKATFTPRAGMEIIAFGSISVYYQGGQYNFVARELIELGLGKLMLQIQYLKQQLIKEGVIDPARRQKLPEIPSTLGVVTGYGTAALRDILKQVNDLYPNVNVLVAPALVQGEGAPESISAAIDEISKPEWKVDVLIVGRGGGSFEDLIAFNDELVCRAIARCPIPVISAVGHQIDHPLSDDVADYAAATPTDGAKAALPDIMEREQHLAMAVSHIENLIRSQFTHKREILKRINEKRIFQNPYSLIENHYHLLDDYDSKLRELFREKLHSASSRFNALPQLAPIMGNMIELYKRELSLLQERLTAFSPLATLKRGYSLVFQKGNLLRSIDQLEKKEDITVRLADGEFRAKPL